MNPDQYQIDTIATHIVSVAQVTEHDVVTFAFVSVNDIDDNERYLLMMETNGNIVPVAEFSHDMNFDIALASYVTFANATIVSASDRANASLTPADEPAIIVPDTATVVSINKEKN